MEHDEVVRYQMTEKYLLDELESADRDAFEEHYFNCPACAADVRAGALFVDHAKTALREEVAVNDPGPVRGSTKPNWFAWLRPAFALPALAALLLVVGYQNLVTIPQLAHKINTPQVLAFASVNLATYGSEAPAIQARPGEGFLILARIPPEATFASYTAKLYDPAQQIVWDIAFPARAGQDEYPLQVPGSNWKSGRYALAVFGVTSGGESKAVGKAQFEVQVQN